jgi:NAD-dependent dihydropyrimidine dehydrogenase PreA subunit
MWRDVMKPEVDESKCSGCGNCVDVCPSEVFEMENDKSKVVRPEECVECETCVSECPEEAIKLVD